jgi:membrane protein involved in colicin uptake
MSFKNMSSAEMRQAIEAMVVAQKAQEEAEAREREEEKERERIAAEKRKVSEIAWARKAAEDRKKAEERKAAEDAVAATSAWPLLLICDFLLTRGIGRSGQRQGSDDLVGDRGA